MMIIFYVAMMQAECYHYLFEAALRLHNLGLDPADPKHGPLKSLKAASSETSNGIVLGNGKQEELSKQMQKQLRLNPV